MNAALCARAVPLILQYSNGYDIMKCPICEMNVWKVEYKPDVNIISLHCQNCDCTSIDLSINALDTEWNLNND